MTYYAGDIIAVDTGDWRFEIGSMVTHKDQPMVSEVLYRHKAGKLGEVYGVRRLEDCEVPDLMLLGEVLVAA